MADAIFYGGDVLTMNDHQPFAEAVAVRDGYITAVGSKAEILLDWKEAGTKLLNLQDNTLLPGFIEPHSHPTMCALLLYHFMDVSAHIHPTMEDMYSKLRDAARRTPPGEWIKAFGYDAALHKGALERPPIRQELDNISTDHPIFVVSQTGHTAHCNSKALEVGKVTRNTKVIHGKLVTDNEGELTGLMVEFPAMFPIWRLLPEFTPEDLSVNSRKQLKEYSRQGFTTVADIGVGAMNKFKNPMHLAKEIFSESGNPVRVVAYHMESTATKYGIDVKTPKEQKEGNFFVVGVKAWADGSPYGASMAVREPYLETDFARDVLLVTNPPHYGELHYKFEPLVEKLRPFHHDGYQLAIHTQGERAIDQALDVYDTLLKEHPRTDHRYRLEHCGLVTEHQLQRCKQIGVTVSFFVDHICFYGNRLKDDIIGPARASRWCPADLANKAGVRWTLHADTPCAPLGIFRTIHSAVTRLVHKDDANDPDEVLGPEFRVSVEDALKGVTINAAWQLFYEDLIGSIEVGKLADFTIVSENPIKVDPKQLQNIKIMETYRNGKCVYSNMSKI